MAGVLQEIANAWPTKVADFFEGRLKVEPTTDEAKRYDAIPFEFHLLQKSLQKIPDYMIDTVRRWFANDNHFFRYRGGRLLSNVFTTFTPEFEQSLQRLCERGDREDLEFLVQILNGYFTHKSLQGTAAE